MLTAYNIRVTERFFRVEGVEGVKYVYDMRMNLKDEYRD